MLVIQYVPKVCNLAFIIQISRNNLILQQDILSFAICDLFKWSKKYINHFQYELLPYKFVNLKTMDKIQY
jgi:hypothetical protein